MTLASRITDAIDALITAINARNAPGASDYQVWLAQGNTGTIDNYRASILGADQDFAAQFNAAIGATPSATTASETRAGITQFATAAEAAAATSAVKAVSPLQIAALFAADAVALRSAGGLGPTSNWNQLLANAIYIYNHGSTSAQATGYPSGAYGFGTLVVFRAGTSVIQVYFPDNGEALYWRSGFDVRTNGVTAGWQRIVSGSTVAALTN